MCPLELFFCQPCFLIVPQFQLTVEQLTQSLNVNHPPCLSSPHACCWADLHITVTSPAGGTLLVILLSHLCHICLAGDVGSCLRHL